VYGTAQVMAQGTSETCRARRGERGMVADAARARLRSARSITWYVCALNGFFFGCMFP
jgi:hypothetical protein